MGLDGVELVLALEEEFEVTIDDRDAANLTTPRKVADYILSRLETVSDNAGRCLSQTGFYRIRSVLMSHFGARRSDVRLESPVQAFLGDDARQNWRVLKEAIGASHLPGLKCQPHVHFSITLGVPVIMAICILQAGGPLWAAVLALPISWVVAHGITDRLGNLVPPSFATIRALVPYAGIANRTEWSQEYVLQRVLQITSVQLGIPLEKILPDHHFVDDLGLDR